MSGPWEDYASGPWDDYKKPKSGGTNFGKEIARQVGLTARYIPEGLAELGGLVANPINSLINMGLKASGAKYRQGTDLGAGASRQLDRAGLPKPRTGTERVVGDMSRAVVGTAPFVGAGQLGAKAATGVTRGVMAALADAPKLQAGYAAASAGGGGAAREAKLGPAGILAGSILPLLAGPGAVAAAGPTRRAFQTMRGNVDVAPRAREIISGTIADDLLSPRDIGPMLDNARANGVNLSLMDLGDNLRGLGAAASRKPGVGRRLITSMVDTRQGEQNARIRGAIGRDLGEIVNPFEQSDALMKQAGEAASPLYRKAYSNPAINSPEIESLLATPAGRSALSRARTIAANERRDPAKMGFSLDADGNVVLNPSNAGLHGTQAEARAARDAIAEQLANAQRRASASLSPAQHSDEITQLTKQLDEADAALQGVDETLAAAPTADVATTQRVYSPQTLDYVKRGLDDVVEANRDKVTRRLALDEGGRAENSVRGQFREELKRLNPDYGEALAAYAGPASAKQAMEAGKGALNYSDQEIERAVSNLSAGDRDQFALGFRSAMAEALDRRVDGGDKVKALLGSPRKRQALAKVFGGEDGFNRFLETMSQERMASETYGAVRLGSPSANRLEEGADAAQKFERGTRAAADLATGNVGGMVSNGLNALRDFHRFGLGKTAQRTRDEVAALLSELDPVIVRSALEKAIRDNAARLNRNGPAKNIKLGTINAVRTAPQIRRDDR